MASVVMLGRQAVDGRDAALAGAPVVVALGVPPCSGTCGGEAEPGPSGA
ncbi:hypothetical protein ACFXOR_21125 [Streptomyces sp. NPDC059164]|nr:hypothetical protein [Streptomyces sp. YPW6]QWQ45320.1 hypothetical protein KME66_33290 [Streptomyces sp. YPW6]